LVNPIITLGIIGIAVVAFLNFGGVQRVSGFVEGIKGQFGKGGVNVPEGQKGTGAIPIKSSSEFAVTRILSTKGKTLAPITERRKFGTGITERAKASSDVLRKLTTFSGSGVAQFSGGQVGGLTASEIQDIRSRTFTTTEQADIKALELRRTRAIERGINPNLKLSGIELVFRKRQQELLSKKFLTDRFGGKTFIGGKLFAKEGFATGGGAVRDTTPTIGKEGQLIENLGAGGSAIIKSRTEAKVATALAFNRSVIEAKKAGLPIPVFQGF